MMMYDLPAIARQFQHSGQLLKAQPYGNGHINDTFLLTCQGRSGPSYFILQRINHLIFKNPVAVMANVERVTGHLRQKLQSQAEPDAVRHTLTLIPTQTGQAYWPDDQGNFWRAYLFINNAKSYDMAETPTQAYEVGRAFGHFQQQLVDLPGPRLIETIPDFHHTPKRFATFIDAVERDPQNRARSARAEIEFAAAGEPFVGLLFDLQQQGQIPERVVHNDTKINNVLLDIQTGQNVCVIDLDTVMPGLALYDFGDMVRSATCFAAEDELDLTKVKMEMAIFSALARGYLETAGPFLTPAEKAHLVFAGKLITFENGLRFLTDYLQGDTYFKTHRPGHNLDRCRTQFKLVDSITAQEEAMQAVVEALL
jgi:hypothetical protein